ncbi:MAG: CoA transferase subunit A [Corynebacterium sp.]|uniref:CoA transferase subunit A n=1 Tax=Corynebacterium sp. TaxID=1720 RepID=UPI0026DFB5EB|nr:CoA transferase subunit A [Corynebacterium sp.]MDO5669935.1 CoA transferase subunit A [Corynebacterium sp.]
MSKYTDTIRDALIPQLHDGMTLAVGGFGICGIPSTLIDIVRDSGVRDLTVVSNNLGIDGVGLGRLLEKGQIARVLASYIGENKLFMEQYLSGAVEVELVPQGTLAERMHAGGAGIAAFYTRTGVGTEVAEGKPTAEFDGETYLQERAIIADISLVRAHTADVDGNLRYRLAARNFNPVVAQCGRLTFAEAEHVLARGELGPDDIHTPGVYIHHLGDATIPTQIEQLTTRPRPSDQED